MKRYWFLAPVLLAALLLAPPASSSVRGSSRDHVLAAPSLATDTSVTDSWSYTGRLNRARFLHTATLLPDGQVLVVAGCGVLYCNSQLASAELYNPATGTWTVTGRMKDTRYGHTATLLPSGQVLVAGGYHGYPCDCALASAELYDPAMGTWTVTGRMNDARSDHTATLLPNGQVLVAAGCNGVNCATNLSSAELYDPATGIWTYTGSMNEARAIHTATLLPSGQVLVAGGQYSTYNQLASAELYNPATGTWTYTGDMNDVREFHTATLLPDGKVLVAGGYSGTYNELASTEVYDPATGTWALTGGMHDARYAHTATLLPDGMVLVAGGVGLGFVASAELYDAARGAWTYTGSLNTARYDHTATLLSSGQVLVAGGQGSSGWLASAELYTQALHVAEITPFYRPQGGRYLVGARITIQDSTSVPVPDASVTVTITLPSGSQLIFTNTTNTNGQVIFRQLVRETGTYSFCVDDVSKSGWTYDPSQNVETCDSVTIP